MRKVLDVINFIGYIAALFVNSFLIAFFRSMRAITEYQTREIQQLAVKEIVPEPQPEPEIEAKELFPEDTVIENPKGEPIDLKIDSETQLKVEQEEKETSIGFPVLAFETLEDLITEVENRKEEFPLKRKARVRNLCVKFFDNDDKYLNTQVFSVVTLLMMDGKETGEILSWVHPYIVFDQHLITESSVKILQAEMGWFENAVAMVLERHTGMMPHKGAMYNISSDALDFIGETNLINSHTKQIKNMESK